MNIFYLHEDPIQNIKWHVDKHVVKMATEYAQLLSTAHRVIDGFDAPCIFPYLYVYSARQAI